MFKRFFLLGVAVITVALFTPTTTRAATSAETFAQYGPDIDEFMSAGAAYYIAWQYSGDKNAPLPNDKYSFYKDSATCAILKSKANEYPGKIGVNIYSLSNQSEDAIREHLTYVKNNCGASIVRFWGFDAPETITKVLTVGQDVGGLKFIVALADFGSIPGSAPTNWYSLGYTINYRPHAEAVADAIRAGGLSSMVYALELVNEPHCYGQASCVDSYVSWAGTMSSLLANKGFVVGLGQMASQDTTRGDSPGIGTPPDFRRSNNFASIGTTSGHYYDAIQKSKVLQALAISSSLGKPFYVGESGFTGGSSSGTDNGTGESKDPQNKGFDWLKYPCNATTGLAGEFDPQRPYPGSPCDPLIPASWPEGPYMSFACGKSLNVEEDVVITPQTPAANDIMPANPVADRPYWCDANKNRVCVVKPFDFNVNIDLSGANIPILGNTQDDIDDATQVNQYLLSYLMGTVQQSEQTPEDGRDSTFISRLVNFSGPLKKLLPFDAQNYTKSNLVTGQVGTQYHNYSVGCQKGLSIQHFVNFFTSYFNSIEINAGELPLFLVTAGKVSLGLADLVFNTPEIAQSLATALRSWTSSDYVETYNHLKAAASQVPDSLLRDISELAHYVSGYFGRLSEILSTLSLDASVTCSEPGSVVKRLNEFTEQRYPNGNLPPDPKDYPFEEYWKLYNNWRGLTNVWLVGPWDIDLNPFVNESVWSQLFKNVPFSTLEDTVGEFTVSVINDAAQQPEGVITGNPNKPITLTITNGDSRISVPHVKALNSLSQLLSNLILPRPDASPIGFDQSQNIAAHQRAGQNPETQKIEVVSNPDYCNPLNPLVYRSDLCNNSSVVATKAAPPPLFTTHDSICDLKDVRINPGDDLYGKNVSAKLTYYQRFSYSPPSTTIPNPGGLPPNSACTLDIQCQSNDCLPPNLLGQMFCSSINPGVINETTEARVAVFSKIPLLDQIYDKLVDGPKSVLRRFLHAQNCEPDCSDEERKHYIPQGAETIPGAIAASYTGEGTVTTGDKSGGGQIYVPRLGSLFDYFLGSAKENKNFQRMFRPKGFGGEGEAGLVPIHNETMAQIATRLGVPQEFIDAIWLLETNRGGSGSFCDCTGTKACGPMAIDRINFDLILTDAEKALYNRCSLPDAFELAARVLLHKKYCTTVSCTYDPAHPTSNGPVTSSDIVVVGRYIGTNNCAPEPQAQCRWGTGVSYCDAIEHIISSGNLPPQGDPDDTQPWCDQL